MLLGVVAALATPVPAVATLACRLAEAFLAGLLTIAHHAAGLPVVTATGPARLLPALLVLALVAAARRRARRLAPAGPPAR